MVWEWSHLLPAGGSVLDVGCGSGVPISETLISRGFQVYGVDASATTVSAFRERFPSVPAECSSALEATFFDRKFDGVVSWGLFFLLHADAQCRLIAKIADALPTGGQLLFTSPWQICSWADAMTGQVSVSLGRDGYRQALESASLELVGERVDEGENHYFFAAKK